MPEPGSLSTDTMNCAQEIAQMMQKSGRSAAVAESLTSGSIACHLGAAEDASDWFRGGLVAYSSDVKFTVLGVDRGPVVTAECARQMARGAATLLDADFSVAVTGAGGPGPEEGKPQGTCYIAACSASTENIEEYRFDGDPEDIVYAATSAALAMLHDLVIQEAG